jgi:hypothetical protein
MHVTHPYIDSPRHAISNGRWYITWFLMVEEIFPLKDEAPKANEEALDLRTKSYKSAPKKCCKQEVTSCPHCNEY